MRLELLELRFSKASSYFQLALEIESMQTEILVYLPDVNRAFETLAVKYSFHPQVEVTYLVFEEQLLRHVREHELLC